MLSESEKLRWFCQVDAECVLKGRNDKVRERGESQKEANGEQNGVSLFVYFSMMKEEEISSPQLYGCPLVFCVFKVREKERKKED